MHPPADARDFGMRFLLVLLALAVSASANVIVYKGSARAGLDAAKQFSKTPRVYLVVDLTSKTGYMVVYYKLNGLKQSTNLPPFDRTRYNSEAITSERRIGTFTHVLDNDIGGGEFGAFMLYLRGTEKALALSSLPTTGNFPRTLTGIFRLAQFVANTPTNFELNFTLTFDMLHTLSANNSFKNGATTFADIGAELTALGY